MFNDDIIQVLSNRLENIGGNNMLLTTTYLQKDLKQTFYVHTDSAGFLHSTVDVTLLSTDEAEEYIISAKSLHDVFNNDEPTADTALYDYCYMMYLHEMYDLNGDVIYRPYSELPPAIKDQITKHYKDWLDSKCKMIPIRDNCVIYDEMYEAAYIEPSAVTERKMMNEFIEYLEDLTSACHDMEEIEKLYDDYIDITFHDRTIKIRFSAVPYNELIDMLKRISAEY